MDDGAEVIRRELQLLDPAVRRDPEAAGRLLHPDFLELGRSGRVWDRDAILRHLASDPGPSGTAPDTLADALTAPLSDDVVLLTYRSADGTLRSSVWVRDPAAGWVVRFHQGTPAGGGSTGG